MSKARNRPPRLETKVGHQEVAPPPTLEERLERSHVAGRATSPGPSELRRLVERAATERAQAVLLDDAWAAVSEVFGGTAEQPSIDPTLTITAACRRGARASSTVADTGAHIALATSKPASLLPVYLALARLARISGGDVADDDEDSSPLRVDGRAARTLRWVDGVAVVTDGQSLCETRGPEAAAEWLFLVPRPALVDRRRPLRRGRARRRRRGGRPGRPRPLLAGGRAHAGPALSRRADVDRPAAGRVPAAARDRARRRDRARPPQRSR